MPITLAQALARRAVPPPAIVTRASATTGGPTGTPMPDEALPARRPLLMQSAPSSDALAKALMLAGASNEPVESGIEAAGKLAQLASGTYAQNQFNKAETEREEGPYRDLAAALAGLSPEEARAKLPELLMGSTSPELQAKGIELFTQAPPKPNFTTVSPGATVIGDDGKPVYTAPATSANEGFTLGEGQTRYGPDGKPIAGQPKPQEGFTLGEGDQRFDAEGNPIAGVPRKPPAAEPFTLGPGETRFGPDGKPLASAPAAGPSTTDTENYKFYEAGEAAAGRPVKSFDEWLREQKKIGASQTTIDMKGESAESAAKGKAIVDHFGKIAEDLPAADQLAQSVNRIDELLSTTETGAGPAFAEWFRQNTGIALSEQADKLQAVSSMVDYLTPRMRVPGSGATSDMEMRAFKNALPTLLGTAEGNALVTQTLHGLAEGRVAMAAIAQDYLSSAIDAKTAIEKMRALPDPFEQFKKAGVAAAPPDPNDPYARARKAIEDGADPEAVKKRLQENGLDPSKL